MVKVLRKATVEDPLEGKAVLRLKKLSNGSFVITIKRGNRHERRFGGGPMRVNFQEALRLFESDVRKLRSGRRLNIPAV